jgi:uncharacterized coiled-coil protein SlyX
MKGDFTRLTFRPDKHYSSVRMQQGRLQLDSDWNEQADIQTHLYRTQVVDLVGAKSGVPTVDGNSDSFKISLLNADGNDLAIAPGHCYVNGTLCELEGTRFDFTKTSTNQVSITTLSIDGRKLEALQWVELYEDDQGNKPTSQKFFKIEKVDNLELTLLLPAGEVLPPSGKMRRTVTYYTQPDYPITVITDPPTDGVNLSYLDVWQHHITTIEDPGIREIALNIPDTTTRSKTVWQLKLEPVNEELIEKIALNDANKTALLTRFRNLTSLGDPDLTTSAWISFTNDIWQRFLQKKKSRQARMNACAKLCSASANTTSNGSGYRRLENQLYRVEIHRPGKSGKVKEATFKWSRDNGSIVSAIEKFQIDDGIITIRKSSQDAWSSSQSGQWIEILDEATELKGLPGALVPLISVSDTKIKFNPNSVRADSIPEQPTKVRRWDHATTNEEAILTQTEWVELEAGIKVKFDETSKYQTGDYWLIPARSSINGIDWPNSQSDREPLLLSATSATPTPLFQSQQGINHDYFLVGAASIKDQKFTAVLSDNQIRNIFLSLAEVNQALDNKANINGDANQDFNAKDLRAASLKLGSGETIKTFSNNSNLPGNDEVVPTVQAVKAYIDNNKANINGDANQNFNAKDLRAISLKLGSGETIKTFSNNPNLPGNNEVVPTAQAVKTYVDTQVTNVNNIDGNINQDFSAKDLRAISLKLGSGETIKTFSNDFNLTLNSDEAIPTEQAIKTYVDNRKAKINGDATQDFDAKDLKADKLFARNVVAPIVTSGSFTQISSRLLKDNITDLTSQEVTQVLRILSPVKFIYTEDDTQHLNVGFIAEDTPDLLTSSDKQAVKIMDVVAILTKAVKDQQILSEELSDMVKSQRSELRMLREKLSVLEERSLDSLKAIQAVAQVKTPTTPPARTLVKTTESLVKPSYGETVRRATRTARRTEWFLYRKLKRFIYNLFNR